MKASEEIKAKDLRIGNLMQDRKGQLCIVKRLEADIDDCKILCIDNASTYLPVEGIPLNEEWLLKLGFKIDIDTDAELEIDGYYINKTILLRQSYKTSKYYYVVNYQYDEPTDIIIIEYVHQLQNLVHSLTGKELTI